MTDDTAPSDSLLAAALAQVQQELRSTRALAPASETRMLALVDRFERFASALGARDLRAVEPSHVEAFIGSRGRTGALPSVATMRLRRSTIRLVFRVARRLGLVDGDPTIDIALPARTDATPRPLTTAEVDECRRAAMLNLTSTRLSAPWALGEATARPAEISRLRVADLDLQQRRVRIQGGKTTQPRFGALTQWGAAQLLRRLVELRGAPQDTLLTHRGRGTPTSREAITSQALREVLDRAGLSADPSVAPASLVGWAGAQIFDATSRIERVALGLGVRSLDRAAEIVRWDWRSTSSEE